MTATTWTWIAKRACWPKTHCASASLPVWRTRSCPPFAPLSKREAKRREPVFEYRGQCVGNGGAARADRSAGGKPCQLGNHAHARRRPVSQKRRGVHRRRRHGIVFFRHGGGPRHESFRRQGERNLGGQQPARNALPAWTSGRQQRRIRGFPENQPGRRHGRPAGRI